MIRVLLFVLLLNLSAASVLHAMGNPEAGLAKSQICAVCHNQDGNSTTPLWPKLAGQNEKYLIKQLKELRKGPSGTRNAPTMYGMVQNLTDQDIQDLAAYYASQKISPGQTKASLLELGEKMYRGGNSQTQVPACTACHGARGEGNVSAGFPKLSGQEPEYVVDQLKKFKTQERSNDPNGIMQDISQRMTEQEIEAVSSYVSGLH